MGRNTATPTAAVEEDIDSTRVLSTEQGVNCKTLRRAGIGSGLWSQCTQWTQCSVILVEFKQKGRHKQKRFAIFAKRRGR